MTAITPSVHWGTPIGPRYENISIDLETLGTDPGSVITQIGVSAFGAPGRKNTTGLWHVDPQSCLDYGLSVSWSTISWWLQQAEKPRVDMATAKGIALPTALIELTQFCKYNLIDDFYVWGNGSGFDVTLLDVAYHKVGLISKIPWKFRNVRDMRTIMSLVPSGLRVTPRIEHDAEQDADAQAISIQNALAWLSPAKDAQ